MIVCEVCPLAEDGAGLVANFTSPPSFQIINDREAHHHVEQRDSLMSGQPKEAQRE